MRQKRQRPRASDVALLFLFDPVVLGFELVEQGGEPFGRRDVDGNRADGVDARKARFVVRQHEVMLGHVFVPDAFDRAGLAVDGIGKGGAHGQSRDRLHERVVGLPRLIVEAPQPAVGFDDHELLLAVFVFDVDGGVVADHGQVPWTVGFTEIDAFLEDETVEAQPSLRDFAVFEEKPVGVGDGAFDGDEMAEQRCDAEFVRQPGERQFLDRAFELLDHSVDLIGTQENFDLQQSRRRVVGIAAEEGVDCLAGFPQVADVP
jgi:hypothetical protein